MYSLLTYKLHGSYVPSCSCLPNFILVDELIQRLNMDVSLSPRSFKNVAISLEASLYSGKKWIWCCSHLLSILLWCCESKVDTTQATRFEILARSIAAVWTGRVFQIFLFLSLSFVLGVVALTDHQGRNIPTIHDPISMWSVRRWERVPVPSTQKNRSQQRVATSALHSLFMCLNLSSNFLPWIGKWRSRPWSVHS